MPDNKPSPASIIRLCSLLLRNGFLAAAANLDVLHMTQAHVNDAIVSWRHYEKQKNRKHTTA